MVGMELSKIIIDEKSQEQVIVLKEKQGNRLLPIIIGINEALAIRIKLSNVEPPRPLTHDLMKNLITALGVTLEKVVIDKVIDNTFHAKLYLKNKDEAIFVVDARPSDSIALAIRTSAPVFVENDILSRSTLK